MSAARRSGRTRRRWKSTSAPTSSSSSPNPICAPPRTTRRRGYTGGRTGGRTCDCTCCHTCGCTGCDAGYYTCGNTYGYSLVRYVRSRTITCGSAQSLNATHGDLQAVVASAEAENNAAPQLEVARKYELEWERLAVLETLAGQVRLHCGYIAVMTAMKAAVTPLLCSRCA